MSPDPMSEQQVEERALKAATDAVMENFALYRDPAHVRRLGMSEGGAALQRWEVEDIMRVGLRAASSELEELHD